MTTDADGSMKIVVDKISIKEFRNLQDRVHNLEVYVKTLIDSVRLLQKLSLDKMEI